MSRTVADISKDPTVKAKPYESKTFLGRYLAYNIVVAIAVTVVAAVAVAAPGVVVAAAIAVTAAFARIVTATFVMIVGICLRCLCC